MPLRFLHLADLHLETNFGGKEGTRARLREATLEAFDAAVELALVRDLDAVLIAGDAFDDPLLSRRTELRFLRGLRRLADGGVTVVIACGNHDPGGAGKRMALLGLEENGDWRERIHLVGKASPKVLSIPNRSGEPTGIVVAAGHTSDRVERNLAAGFAPQATDLPVVGLLHTQVHQARGATEHSPYAPCAHEDLEHLGYDYFALGHVHIRQRPFEDLPAWYAGNIQGRNSRERGEKGGLVVELHRGEPAVVEFVPLGPVIWEHASVEDLSACVTATDLTEHLTPIVKDHLSQAQGREVALVLELTGTCQAASVLRAPDDRRAFEEDLAEAGGALEVQIRSRGLRPLRNMSELRAAPSVLGAALELLELARQDREVLERIAPAELAGLEEGDRQVYLSELLADLEEELLDRCLEERP